MCGVNKLTSEMVVILSREKWTSLFGHGTFQRYVWKNFRTVPYLFMHAHLNAATPNNKASCMYA